MIVITGALGFIGSCLTTFFNEKGFLNIIGVDDFSKENKYKNLQGKKLQEKVERSQLEDWLKINGKNVTFIIHIGARTDTAEFDYELLDRLNLNYTKMIWNSCVEYDIPLIYASSAATYGLGEYGFTDSHELVEKLRPLNPYGDSKNEFDKWALRQSKEPRFWAGLKFFNVYGPNEYHKGRMASVILHFFNQIMESKAVKLFRSHNPNYANGEQKRDFIFVKDVLDIIYFLFSNIDSVDNGLYNTGTGNARTFNDLAKALFKELNLPSNISYMDTPEDIRDKYQYFTEADMNKLINAGYNKKFTELEEGIAEYVNNYLKTSKYF